MAARKYKKKFWQKFVVFLIICYPKTHLVKALNSIDSSRPNRRLLQNPKTGGFRELFLPKSDCKTCFAVNFSKTSRFWWPENQNMPFYT